LYQNYNIARSPGPGRIVMLIRERDPDFRKGGNYAADIERIDNQLEQKMKRLKELSHGQDHNRITE
jgi:hypothetical protein